MFPAINHINEILPYVEGNSQFRVAVQPNGYTVVCYMLQDENTFAGENEHWTRECRGITFAPNGKVASRTMHKFQNVGESDATQPDQIPWDKITRIMDKRDGCCSEETILITEDGKKTIAEICETRYFGKVLGYKEGQNVFTKILGHEIKPNNDDWYEIELENGKQIKLTGNHLVWVENKNCYVRVDELTLDDQVRLK